MKHKTLGQVFTPPWIVDEILDLVGYNKDTVLDKYILEPSSGDGVFMLEIVKRYIDFSIKKKIAKQEIAKNIEKYIYGIELDEIEYHKSIENLDALVKSKLGEDISVDWNIIHGNTLHLYTGFLEKFDFVVGNPPYIRIHNLDLETRELIKANFIFSEGTIDIYLSFFEMGLKMLNSKGILGFITPNSYLHNTSYSGFRKYLKENKLVQTLIDFKANKIFKGFSTYTSISILNKDHVKESFTYKELVDNNIETVNQVPYSTLKLKDWSFTTEENTLFLKTLSENRNGCIKDYFDVQYGFATLRDKIFIANIKEHNKGLVWFNDHLMEKDILQKIVKGSRFKGDLAAVSYVIFPYTLQGERYVPISETELKKNYPNAYAYLLKNKEELEKRDIDKGAKWYEFGRSQGVQTMHNEKIVLSTLINGDIKFYRLPADVFVYSGLYIIKNKPHSEWSLIEQVLSSEEFYRYIRITGKDFSGGYKSITSKQIKEFRIKK